MINANTIKNIEKEIHEELNRIELATGDRTRVGRLLNKLLSMIKTDKKKLHRTGGTIGRWQGFNLGHKYMIDMLLDLCERVAIIISDDLVTDKRNPFPKEVVKRMIEAVYKDEIEEGRVVITFNNSGHIPEEFWGAQLLKIFYEALGTTPELVLHGDEQCRRGWLNEQQREHTTETFVANHPIQDGKILEFRGTMVRETLENNDFEAFKQLVDVNLHPMFEELRQYIIEANKEG